MGGRLINTYKREPRSRLALSSAPALQVAGKGTAGRSGLLAKGTHQGFGASWFPSRGLESTVQARASHGVFLERTSGPTAGF
jgi:hypothetical protein